MFKIKAIIITIVISLSSFSSSVIADSLEIQMLNKLGKEKMVFSKKMIKINLNEVVVWKAVSKGHNVEFISFPKGVTKYKSKMNKDAQFTFDKPGIYLYQCTPHKAMGMIGIVIVNNDLSNIENIKKAKVYGKSKKILKNLLSNL